MYAPSDRRSRQSNQKTRTTPSPMATGSNCESGSIARWPDIDFDKRIWTIPAERMKKRRLHTIPLTEHALSLLETPKPLPAYALQTKPLAQFTLVRGLCAKPTSQ